MLKKPLESYRQILRSSSIIGGASVVSILIGLLRTKAAAVLLGPAGVGMIGLFQSLMGIAAHVSSLGLRTVGTRQVAEAIGRQDEAAVAAARRALFWGTMGLSLVGAGAFWLLRNIFANEVLADPARGAQVGWLSVGVALSVAAGSQTAVLTGLRRVGDLARISVASSLLSTALGVAALLKFDENGALVFVLVAPASSFALGHWFVSRLGRVRAPATPLALLLGQWRTMVRLGAAFMLSGLVVMFGELATRLLISRELGVDALGQFQASWTISVTYTGLVLAAMSTDYYPRLAAVIQDHAAANRLVNEQTEVALLLAGPLFLAVIGMAPWAIELLYSRDFAEAGALLRWQAMGDIPKVACYPLGYAILATGAGRMFLFSESITIGIYVIITWIGLPLIGLRVTGMAFVAMYSANLAFVFWVAHRRSEFLWTRPVALHFYALIAGAIVVCSAAAQSQWLGAAAGVVTALIAGAYAVDRLGRMIDPNSRAGQVIAVANKMIRSRGQSHE
jgi:PST family polysaccharide transporter